MITGITLYDWMSEVKENDGTKSFSERVWVLYLSGLREKDKTNRKKQCEHRVLFGLHKETRRRECNSRWEDVKEDKVRRSD